MEQDSPLLTGATRTVITTEVVVSVSSTGEQRTLPEVTNGKYLTNMGKSLSRNACFLY